MPSLRDKLYTMQTVQVDMHMRTALLQRTGVVFSACHGTTGITSGYRSRIRRQGSRGSVDDAMAFRTHHHSIAGARMRCGPNGLRHDKNAASAIWVHAGLCSGGFQTAEVNGELREDEDEVQGNTCQDGESRTLNRLQMGCIR